MLITQEVVVEVAAEVVVEIVIEVVEDTVADEEDMVDGIDIILLIVEVEVGAHKHEIIAMKNGANSHTIKGKEFMTYVVIFVTMQRKDSNHIDEFNK